MTALFANAQSCLNSLNFEASNNCRVEGISGNMDNTKSALERSSSSLAAVVWLAIPSTDLFERLHVETEKPCSLSMVAIWTPMKPMPSTTTEKSEGCLVLMRDHSRDAAGLYNRESAADAKERTGAPTTSDCQPIVDP
nr:MULTISPECIES: hypothetical protein [unclassified Mesorhizobium]